jgi:CheY-like chemotaxis protein
VRRYILRLSLDCLHAVAPAEDDALLGAAVARGLRENAYALDAVAVCRELRRRGLSVPILLLTALGAAEGRIARLDARADDYVTKPFAFGELLPPARR